MTLSKISTLFLLFTLFSCKSKEILVKNPDQPKVPIRYDYKDQILTVKLSNPFRIPIRCQIESEDKLLTPILQNKGNLLIGERRDTTLSIAMPDTTSKPALKFKVLFGDLNKKIEKHPLALPFPIGRSYKIVQANFGKFTHWKTSSRFALDISLAVGDTVCAADDGVVIGVIQSSKRSGNSEKFINDANYITLYHPKTGLMTQYVHLSYNGSIVAIGDSVTKGQSIGIAGMSGFTNIPHLHFNVYTLTAAGWESTPVDFEDGYIGIALKKGQAIRRAKKL